MVWEASANGKVGDLYQVKAKFNQIGYHSIQQQHHTIPSGTWLVGPEFLLLQDNDAKHTSKLCQKYIKNKEEKHDLQLMSWWAQSAVLNYTEPMWDELDQNQS